MSAQAKGEGEESQADSLPSEDADVGFNLTTLKLEP